MDPFDDDSETNGKGDEMTYLGVQGLFSNAAEKFDRNIAIEYGDRHITYRQLEERSNRLANFLIHSGVAKGSVIAIYARDVAEIITAMIGVLKAGCAFLPIDPRTPEKRAQAMLAQVLPKWFIAEPEYLEDMVKAVDGLSDRITVICPTSPKTISAMPSNIVLAEGFSDYQKSEKPDAQSDANDLAYIYFTSGSTGKPKGIMGRLKGIDHFINWEIKTLGVEPETRVSQLTNPDFDAFLRDVFVPLCAGGVVCIPASSVEAGVGEGLRDWIDAQRINIVHCVPSVFRSIINAGLKAEHFKELRYVLMAGEPLLPSDVGRWMDVYGDRVQLVNLYGPTETTMTKFFYFVTPADTERKTIPIGKPMDGARAVIVDERGKACAPGAAGEIYIRTPFRSLGYYEQPELTAEVFVPNPFNNDPADLVYKTGDIGRVMSDGNFEFLGRRDHQVKIRGVRIEIAELESLLRTHPAVADVALADRDDDDGTKYLCAYVVLRESTETNALKDFLSKHLPEYSIPSTFVVMEELPRTPNGKVDRRALPAPGRSRLNLKGELVRPRDLTELQLMQIWEGLLNIHPIGVTDDFFDLGGHSLLAIMLLNRVHKAFGRNLPLATLLQNATIEGLATCLREQADSQSQPTLVEIQPLGSRTPFFCVHSSSGDVLRFANLARNLGMDQPFYGFQARGLDGQQEPFTRIEDMAAHYVDVMRKLQPEGPYVLGGWSFGGVVAYEMAQQLRAQGQEVGLLALFDAHTKGTNRQVQRNDQELTATLLSGMINELGMDYEEFRRLESEEQITVLVDEVEKKSRTNTDFAHQLTRRYLNVSKTNMRILGDYVPKTYDGNVDLFYTNDTRDFPEFEQEPARGWDSLTSGVEIHPIPGNHSNLLDEPNVKGLAEALRNSLERAASEREGL